MNKGVGLATLLFVVLTLGLVATNIAIPWIAKTAIQEKNKTKALNYIIVILVLNALVFVSALVNKDENGNRKILWGNIILSTIIITLSSIAYHLLNKSDSDIDTSEKLMTAVFGINLVNGIFTVIGLILFGGSLAILSKVE